MKRTRILKLIVGTMIFLVAGLVYAWTTFSLSISQEYPHWNSLVWIFFCVGGILSAFLISNAYRVDASEGRRMAQLLCGAGHCGLRSDLPVRAGHSGDRPRFPCGSRPKEPRSTRSFHFQNAARVYYLWGILFVGCGGGLVAHASWIAMESSSTISPATVALAASLISVCNGVFRSLFGAIFARSALDRKKPESPRCLAGWLWDIPNLQ